MQRPAPTCGGSLLLQTLPRPGSTPQASKLHPASCKPRIPIAEFQAPSSKLEGRGSKLEGRRATVEAPNATLQAPSSKLQAPSSLLGRGCWPLARALGAPSLAGVDGEPTRQSAARTTRPSARVSVFFCALRGVVGVRARSGWAGWAGGGGWGALGPNTADGQQSQARRAGSGAQLGA